MSASPCGRRSTVVACVVLLLSLCSSAAVGQVPSAPADIPPTHWSGLPIWSAEAEARGYDIPLPFGIGLTGYSARQPVNLQDLQLGRSPNPPRSVTNFLQIDRVDTKQQNVSLKFDILVLPFLDVYLLGGYTTGSTKGVIQVPADPILGIIEPQQLQLNASFNGATYGYGVTLQGGTKIKESPDLIVFGVADLNQTKTDLRFSNETLLAGTKPVATVFSARVGLSGSPSPTTKAAMWVGGMYQKIQQDVAGTVAGTDLQFIVLQSAAKPWNTLVGGLFEWDKRFGVLLEGGLGARMSILGGIGFRF